MPLNIIRFATAFLLSTLWVQGLAAPQLPLELSVTADKNVVIPKNSFKRDYLLAGSIIPQIGAATSTGLAGKIVRFELFPDGVDLYESTQGLVVTEDLPARRLLATFPILEQDANRVVIDFNKGMRRVFTEIWYSTGNSFNRMDRDRTLEVPQGRVFEAEAKDNQLVIRQSVQTRTREGADQIEERYELRYFITAYSPSTEVGREQRPSETRYARFFETAGRLEKTTGRTSSKIARFDVSQPIVFNYSANTPKDYEVAVRDGILYWNRAFGRELVRAERAPENITAPDSRYNLIQWVPWDNAGSAYADLLIDPLTGESRHGQAYMTSVFALSGKSRARAALRSMREMAGDKKTRPFWGYGFGSFNGLETSTLCRMDVNEFAAQYAQGIEDLLANDGLSDAAVLKASQDYVREVVAHEVGHILGLRHNFAGSLASTITRKELDDWFRDYLLGKGIDTWTNRLVTSSMMEYSDFKAAVFVGWRTRANSEPLPHDRAAIQWGYFDSKEPTEKKMLFATDQDAGQYGDVQRFDYGEEPLIAEYGALASDLRLLPNALIERFIGAKAPRDPKDRIPLEQLNLNVKAQSGTFANRFGTLLSWFSSGTRSLRVENQFEFIGDLNRRERMEAHWKSLTNQLEKLGGVDRVFFQFLPVDLKLEIKDFGTNAVTAEKMSSTNLQERLVKLLDSTVYTNFTGLDDKRYSFSSEEKQLIAKRGQLYFEELEKETLKLICQKLENASRDLALEASGGIADSDPVAKLEQRILDLSRTILLAKDDSKRVKGRIEKSTVEVIDFKYDHESRMAAAKSLNDKTGAYRGWSLDAKSDINKALKEDVEGSLNIPNFKDFKDSMLSRSLREWYLKQQDVLGLLPARPASSAAK